MDPQFECGSTVCAGQSTDCPGSTVCALYIYIYAIAFSAGLNSLQVDLIENMAVAIFWFGVV